MFNKDNAIFGLVCATVTAVTATYCIVTKRSGDAEIERCVAEAKAAEAKETYWRESTKCMLTSLGDLANKKTEQDSEYNKEVN